MRTVVWISGASSGIGAALADSVPYDRARVIGISRRPPARGEHVEADLSRPPLGRGSPRTSRRCSDRASSPRRCSCTWPAPGRRSGRRSPPSSRTTRPRCC